MGKYKLIKPTEPLVKQYNRIWDGEQSEEDYQIKIFEDVRVDIRDYFTEKEIKTLGDGDKKILNYYKKKDVFNFFSEINSIYHTRLKTEDVAAEWSLSDETKTLDDLVELCKDKTKSYAYSFASKVFSFMYPNEYPIMDRYVVNMLKTYLNSGISSWGDYQKYIEAYKRFKEKFNLNILSYKEIDKFLWTYGKLLGRYWKNEGVLLFDSTVWYQSKKKK